MELIHRPFFEHSLFIFFPSGFSQSGEMLHSNAFKYRKKKLLVNKTKNGLKNGLCPALVGQW